MKIVFVASEGVPFAKTGGLADVVGALPKALAKLGHDVEVILPRYRITKSRHETRNAGSLTIPLGSGFKFATIQEAGSSSGVRTFLLDCPEFFDRDGLYQLNGKDYPDNAERFAAFSMGAIEVIKRCSEPPDVIHCHDWQSSLVPIYLHSVYQSDPFFGKTSVMLTIHNLGYQGLFPADVLPQISVPWSWFTIDGLEYFGQVNPLKGGIVASDFVTTVSRKYAQEIQTAEYGCGLEGVLRNRGDRLQGILNGVDYDDWNPATDKHLPAQYSPRALKGKAVCKEELLHKMGVSDPVSDRPVIGIVSRFATQKGFDLIAEIAEPLMALNLYAVALGTGEPQYEELFRMMAARYPEKFLVRIAYDNALAHQIEAGADMFLMPSRYEPCGLNQIYSLKYGTVPVVRATGGLDDTIEPFDGNSGTGFKFVPYSASALLEKLQEALEVFRQPKVWRKLMLNGMKKDFSWTQSAKQYAAAYERLRKGKTAASRPAPGL
jgi:starch synthase